MKKIKRILIVVFAAIIMIAAVGCKASVEVEDTGHIYTFKNNSSYTVIVTPEGQSWNAVTLYKGETVTFEVMFDDILSFDYDTLDPALSDRVEYTYVNGVYTFVDKAINYVTNTYKNESGYQITISYDGKYKILKPGDTANLESVDGLYTYSFTNAIVTVTKVGNVVTFTTKTSSNSITVINRVDLNISGNPSGLSFGIHQMTWGIPEGLASDVWFTPDTQYEAKFTNPSTGSHYIPTLKTGNSCIKSGIVSDVYGRYLYFVLTGTTDFEYWRTTDLIKIGDSVGNNKSYIIYANSELAQTDENGNDLPNVSQVGIVVVEVTNDGKRSIQKEIPVTRIK